MVVPTLSFALPVERHGHDDIGGELISVAWYKLRQSLCKPNAQSPDLLELQQKNRLNERATIDGEAARAIKGIGFVLARGTEPRLFFILRQAWKRKTADLASNCRHSFK